MSTDCSSPSPPATSGLQAPTLPEAPEIQMEVEETSPGASEASPEAPTAPATPESPDSSPGSPDEGMDVTEGEPSTSDATAVVPHPGNIDMAEVFRNNQLALQALIAGGTLSDNPTLAISKLFSAVGLLPQVKTEPGAPEPKKARLKVFSNGFFMTFDKISSCKMKHFWRCEYKNTCKARMHTDIESEKIVTYIHDHNHTPPTPEEVRLYGIDPTSVERNRVYIVGNVADTNARRKIRKQVADREAAAKRLEEQKKAELQKQQNEATIKAAQEAYARAISSGAISGGAISQRSPMAAAASLLQSASTATAPINPHALLLAQLPYLNQGMARNEIPGMPNPAFMASNMSMPSSSPPVPPPNVYSSPLVIQSEVADAPAAAPVPNQPSTSNRPLDPMMPDPDMLAHPLFEPTFQIARQLRKMWSGVPKRYPRPADTPTDHFDFYVAKYDGGLEHLYNLIRLERRDEAHMKNALERFFNEEFIGPLLFKVSPKICIAFNKPMLDTWENNQFFLVDTRIPSCWKMMYVDDQCD
ncbi:hypothetical protein GCK72_013293 [Caenorhabditis remanei]|uniref:FLYWCH-type domain-containing protein n=1 Tax=Caenorhabditis remanei TaxID=31234 RepID=A0A6A5GQU5_CAERE|nr:hypothetical protein GCK72_013293 [Caenorhabditis remanei]KAF1756839.1 hypothetical protein GCK72_013293 [Caenorhabditis remanei]